MALSLFCYVKFHQQRYREFTQQWWGWLLATGAALACTLGCKMVGLFTFMTVGAAVLWDLWGILDIKRGYPMVSGRNLSSNNSPTSGATSSTVPSASSSFPSLSIFHSSGSTSKF